MENNNNEKLKLNNDLLLNILVMVSKLNQGVMVLLDLNNNGMIPDNVFLPPTYKDLQDLIDQCIKNIHATISNIGNIQNQGKEAPVENEKMEPTGDAGNNL